MAESQIQPHKIRAPIQLLAVWFATLVITEGAFLTAAATITTPPWISPMLAVASVLFVPTFLIAAIVMQTRFRAHLQEDLYFSEWQKRQEEQLGQLDKGQQLLKSDIKAIQIALKGIVTKHEIEHLRGLKSDEPYMKPYATHLWKELDRLDAIGFILPKPEPGHEYGMLTKIREDHEKEEQGDAGDRPKFNLHDYVVIIQEGIEYVDLYDKYRG